MYKDFILFFFCASHLFEGSRIIAPILTYNPSNDWSEMGAFFEILFIFQDNPVKKSGFLEVL